MKNKKILLPAVAILIAGIGLVSITKTSLAAGMNKKNNKVENSSSELRINKNGRGMNSENRELNEADRLKKKTAIQAAISANDYNAWVTAVGANSPMLTKINKDNFYKLVQAHTLRQQANVLMTELGINQGRGQGMGLGQGHINQ